MAKAVFQKNNEVKGLPLFFNKDFREIYGGTEY